MSTLKVDTYLTRGGASEIAIDKLKGVTAAGSMLVVGEGGTTTTNLQQGLAKVWVFMTDNVITDSLNTSSSTDEGTGHYTITIANDMANVNFASGGNAHENINSIVALAAKAAGSYRIKIKDDAGTIGDTNHGSIICGDLA